MSGETECKHENLRVINDYEGYGPGEPHLTRYFTTYYCPDCDYDDEVPPPGWEPDYEPYDPSEGVL